MSNYYSEEVKNIESIEFTIFRNSDIKKYSHISEECGISLPESYENYEPKKGGLVDLRLGTCDIYLYCLTCGENTISCPGHFGHIDLVKPVFHYGFIKHLKTIIQCICIKCSNLLINKSNTLIKKLLSKSNKSRFKDIKSLAKKVNNCPICNAPIPKIKRDLKEENGSIKILLEYSQNTNIQENEYNNIEDINAKKIRIVLTPNDCYNTFKKISDEDSLLLGFNSNIQRPEDLLIQVFPVAPVIIRPSAKIDFMTAATMEDALTQKISDIIRLNNRVKKQYEKEIVSNQLTLEYKQDLYYTLLQYHIATYFGNDSITLPKSEFKIGGKKLKSISERIKGKYGRVRNNLMGKRVEFSARTVITPDPYVDINKIGVPKKIAMELTIPEEVTQKNINKLTKLINNGGNQYPGANFILRNTFFDGKQDVQIIDLKYRKKEISLKIGDIVERHMVNGDFILFNRQPSLHKISMMGHEIQVINSNEINTFRLNVSVCKPYNADFDGDEMNLHLGQSIQSRNEIEYITNVKYQIISCKDSNPIIGCQQDTLSGAYMMTIRNKKINGKIAANILSNTYSLRKKNFNIHRDYTGTELFSYILPENLNLEKYNSNKHLCKIINGNIISGILDKSLIGFDKNSIIHYIWNKYGANKTKEFIDDTQRLILNYLLMAGQTTGLKDIIIDDSTYNEIQTIVNTEILNSKCELSKYEFDNDFKLEIIESKLTESLNIVQANVGKLLMDKIDNDNFFSIAIKSGAKGSLVNIAQVSGVIGQQILSGSRLKINNDRTLMYFHKFDNTPEARGFIKSSYLFGLSGSEFFINASAGREGLIDTAIKTAQTGYINCQLVKGLEDITVKYDNTIRNSKNIIIQMIYGDNSINQIMQIQTKLNIINTNNDKLKEEYIFSENEIKKLSSKLNINISDLNNFNDSYYDKIKDYRDKLRIIQNKKNMNYSVIIDNFMLPINIIRIIQDFNNNQEKIELDPFYIIKKIENFLISDENIILLFSNKNKYFLKDEKDIKFLLEIALNEYLCPKKCIFKYGLSKQNFNDLIDELQRNFIKSLIDPGEMVGVIAAQSIGEPTTQLNLNTKHFAGISSKGSANMGVERIQELLHYSKNIKTPIMEIYMENEYNNEDNVRKISSHFSYLKINDLISIAEIYYDIDNNSKLHQLLVSDNVDHPFFVDSIKSNIYNLPFVFRFVLNKEKLIGSKTTLLDIKSKFISYWNKYYINFKNLKKKDRNIISNINKCAILSNGEVDNNFIIHIRFNMNNFNYDKITYFLKMVCNDIILKGIKNINGYNYKNDIIIKDFDPKTGNIIEKKEYVIYTDGINFEKIKYIKGIDKKKTLCNDINTIYRLYGIEATRSILLHELELVYISSNINYAHLSLLVDQMTHLGEIISIDRHGLNKLESSPLSKVSFEQQMDHFINAAIYNEKDNIKSVSSRVAIGKTINGGTCSFDIIFDSNKLHNSEYTENEISKDTFVFLEEDPLMGDIIKYKLSKYYCFIP